MPTPSGRRDLMCSELGGNQDGQNSGNLTKAARDEAEERGFEGQTRDHVLHPCSIGNH